MMLTFLGLLFTTGSALAAAPEKPEVSVEDTTAVVATPSTEAILHGVLDPNIASGTPSEVLDYEFVYRESNIACKGAGEVKTVPQGFSLGMGEEEVSAQQITGLKPGAEYTACLLAHNSSNLSEETPSAPITFKTPLPPEKPVTEAPEKVTGNTATLRGELNPGSTATNGYHFAYNTNGECTGGSTSEPGTEEKATKRKVKTAVTGLEPLREYTVCVVSTNAAGEEAIGNAVKFDTPAAPPIIESESAPSPKAEEAHLEALVNPNNQLTECHFQYGRLFVTENELACTPELLKGYGGQGVSAAVGGLLEHTVYHYRIVAKNGKGEESTEEKSFETPIKPEAPTTTEPATAITETTATLEGVLNPGGGGEAGSYEFAYRQSAGECQKINPETGVAENENATPTTPAPAGTSTVSASLAGLAPGAQYTFCLLSRNEAGETALGAPVTFRTLSVPPTVLPESTSATEVTDKSAELHAQINPGGGATTYHFEYDTTPYKEGEAAHGTSTPESGSIGSDNNPHAATAAIEGLEPGTVYHYRVVATNAAGGGAGSTVDGPDATFTTHATASNFTLPDNRAWEQVSPVDKHGARLEAITKEGGLIQAAVDGSAFTYVSNAPTETQPEGNGNLNDSQIISVRGSAGGWSNRDLATPHEALPSGVGVGQLEEYYAFTPDLTRGIVEPKGPNPQLAANASENTVFIRENLREPIGGNYTALINDENTAPGTHYGNRETNLRAEYVASSSNLEHVVVVSVTPLTAAYPTGGYYEWTGGVLTPVVVLPNGEFPSFGAAAIGDNNFNVRNAVSEDGDHVFFTLELNAAEYHLYVRDVALGRTVQIDLPQGVGPSPERPQPAFSYATPDGERVYFTDDQRLTVGATAEEFRPDLYEYNTSSGVLTDLTPDTSEGIGSAVGGEVIGASPDGEYVYFVANAPLAAGAQPGEPNLYVERVTPAGNVISLITTLSGADAHDSGSRQLTKTTARVSPDGRFLAFMSSRALTGYDNTNAGSPAACGQGGICDQEVFEYDAVSGKLSCVSCDPTGARPHGVLDTRESGEGLGLLIDRPEVWEGSWLAGSVPGWTEASPRLEQSDYQSKYLGDSGRLFFNAADALVPQDTNGKEDVYEYEPEGVGPKEAECGPAAASGSIVYKPEHAFVNGEGLQGKEPAGCVGLISSGTSDKESAFLDASGVGKGGEEGEDVFFLTASPLASTDIDAADDVYDAHVCSSEAPCAGATVVPPPCTTADSCKAAPASQPSIFGSGPTETFSGPGNPASVTVAPKKTTKKTVKCVKPKKLSHGRCVKRAGKRSKRARKSNRGARS